MLSPVFKFRTGLKGADVAKRTLAWQFLEALTWENYRESMLHNVKFQLEKYGLQFSIGLFENRQTATRESTEKSIFRKHQIFKSNF